MSIIIADRYSGDGPSDWQALAAAGTCMGAFLKVTEGIEYKTDWFRENWPALRAAGGARYGQSWFRGAYHYLIFHDDAAQQADYFLQTIDAAGGFDCGDLLPVVDVELGKPTSANHKASAQQIVDCTSAFVKRLKDLLGCPVILYGRGAMQKRQIQHRMECDYLWLPRYNHEMGPTEDFGWPRERVLLWQYTDGEYRHPEYPHQVDGLGPTDLSIYHGDLDHLSKTLLWVGR